MRISTKIRLNLMLYVAIFFGAGIVLFISFSGLRALVEKEQRVENLLISTLELGQLTERYFTSPELAPLWFSRYELLGKRLAVFEQENREQARRVALILTQYTSIREMFLLVQKRLPGDGTLSGEDELTKRLRSQLQVKFHDIFTHFAQFNGVKRRAIISAERLQVGLIIGSFIVGSLAAVSLFFWLRKSILVPLQNLGEATRIVGRGHFDLPAKRYGNDEIGALADAFTAMTGNLAMITTSRDNLEREIRERERAEAARAAVEQQLRQAQQLEAIGTMAGGFAHRFNNLLASIIGFAEMARDESAPGSAGRDYLDEVMAAAEQATTLVGRVMTFSHQAINMDQSVEPEELVRGYLAELSDSGRLAQDIEVSVDCDDAVAPVQMNSRYLRLILDSLCSNSLEAMGGSGRLSVRLENVTLAETLVTTISPLNPGNYVVLTVTDTGGGVNPELAKRIFDPFFTTNGVRLAEGIGLAMVLGLAAKHGGSVRLVSEEGVGASFSVYLPVASGE